MSWCSSCRSSAGSRQGGHWMMDHGPEGAYRGPLSHHVSFEGWCDVIITWVRRNFAVETFVTVNAIIRCTLETRQGLIIIRWNDYVIRNLRMNTFATWSYISHDTTTAEKLRYESNMIKHKLIKKAFILPFYFI